MVALFEILACLQYKDPNFTAKSVPLKSLLGNLLNKPAIYRCSNNA